MARTQNNMERERCLCCEREGKGKVSRRESMPEKKRGRGTERGGGEKTWRKKPEKEREREAEKEEEG